MLRTFKQPLDLSQLGRIVQLAKVLGLLCEVLSLYGRVPLEGNNFGRRVVQIRD